LPVQPLTLGSVLASEITDPNLWYPTILGVLVVVAGILLFVGSIYLILGTNMGARLAFLVTFTGFMGLMVLMTALWITTSSPLNTLRGSVPAWEIKEVVSTLDESDVAEVQSIQEDGTRIGEAEAANIKAAVDEGLVTKVDNAVETFTPEDNEFAQFSDVTDYLVTNTWEIGGSDPSFLDFEFTHTPKFAVVQFCGTAPNTQPFGVAPDEPSCAAEGTPEAESNGFVILEYNLGDVRLPPIIAFISTTILFVLGLLMLGWYEKDRRAVAAAAAAPPRETIPERVREPANV
jgi:hypothetical protein